jgi:hypothetical protein
MEAIYSSETSVDFQLTTRRYIPEDRHVHLSSCRGTTRKLGVRDYDLAEL